MTKTIEQFFDEEPQAVCENCDSWRAYADGLHQCRNRTSINAEMLTGPRNACASFFPDPKRWPEADHD